MDRHRHWLVITGVLLSIGVALSSQMFFQSMGILLISTSPFLRPRMVAGLAAVILAIGLWAVAAIEIDDPGLRMANVVLLCLLALLISVARESRVSAIDRMRAREASVLGSCADAILVVDAHGALQQANPSAMQMLPAAQLGQPLHRILEHRLENGEPCPGDCALAGLPATKHSSGETVLGTDGRIHVEYVAAPIEPDLSVISVRDVTERVTADGDRRALLESAIRLREQSLKVAAFGSARGAVDPDVPGVDLDLWSIPAGPGVAGGSDVVDVGRMPDGRVAILLVDGLESPGLTTEEAWTVLYVARAYVFSRVPLGKILERTALTLEAQEHPPRASVLAGTFEPATGRVEVALGGHPPPLVVRGNGSVEWLLAGGTAGGIPNGHVGQRATASTVLHPGDRLVLYTDGVIDGDRDLVEGLSALRSAATARRSIPGRGWTRSLLEALLPDGAPTDAATVLTLCRPDYAAAALGDARGHRGRA